MSDKTNAIRWYQTELEFNNDLDIQTPIISDEIEAVRKATKGPVPEDRLIVMAKSRKSSDHAKELLSAQTALSKSNFIVVANKFLTTSVEESMESNDIVLNILALVDRRVEKKLILTWLRRWS